MGTLDIDNASKSDQTGTVQEFQIAPETTDGSTGNGETTWQNDKWTTYLGYFNKVPDLKSALILKSVFNVGKGYTTDDPTQVLLDNIIGWGKDSFDDILFNQDLTKNIGGESYAEIIRDEESGRLINLKPLDPSTIRVVTNEQGMIKRYEQLSKSNKEIKKFKPEDLFVLTNNRLADNIHGTSDVVALQDTINADMESFNDMRKGSHRQARPMIMFKLGTDNPTKIAAFVKKMDEATNKGENIYIPDDDNSVKVDIVQISLSQVMLEWRNDLRGRFYRAIQIPQVVASGSGQSTESESKTLYFTFEQVVEHRQRYLEKQLWNQLAIKINLVPPATLAVNLQNDESKDGAGVAEIAQPQDTQVGVGA